MDDNIPGPADFQDGLVCFVSIRIYDYLGRIDPVYQFLKIVLAVLSVSQFALFNGESVMRYL